MSRLDELFEDEETLEDWKERVRSGDTTLTERQYSAVTASNTMKKKHYNSSTDGEERCDCEISGGVDEYCGIECEYCSSIGARYYGGGIIGVISVITNMDWLMPTPYLLNTNIKQISKESNIESINEYRKAKKVIDATEKEDWYESIRRAEEERKATNAVKHLFAKEEPLSKESQRLTDLFKEERAIA